MITRDNKFSISGTAQSARQRLGEVLKHYRGDRNLTLRDVANRCKVSTQLVEEWEAGKQLPNGDEWKALCRGVNRALNAFTELYHRARKEADDDARERGNRSKEHMTPTTKINGIADKLARAIDAPQLVVVPPPAPEPPRKGTALEQLGQTARGQGRDGRKLPPVKPEGSYSSEAIARRKAYVRELFAQRPKMRTSGDDSVLEAVRKTFGIGISPETVEAIREELRLEAIRGQLRAELLEQSPKPVEIKPVPPAAHHPALDSFNRTAAEIAAPAPSPTPHASTGDIETAVQLILEALPHLQTFTISVDEHGEASVDFQIRKVVITTDGGSFKVKR